MRLYAVYNGRDADGRAAGIGIQASTSQTKSLRTCAPKAFCSQEELAHRAGMHYTYVGGLERGEGTLALVNMGALASALGVSLAELFSPLKERPSR